MSDEEILNKLNLLISSGAKLTSIEKSAKLPENSLSRVLKKGKLPIRWVAKLTTFLESLTQPTYKEGGLYRFENGGFVEKRGKNDITAKRILDAGKNGLTTLLTPDGITFSPPPLNKEDENLFGGEPLVSVDMEFKGSYIELPKDFVDIKKVGVVQPDGTVKELIHGKMFKTAKRVLDELAESPSIPTKQKGESGIDFSIRLAEFKEKNKLK